MIGKNPVEAKLPTKPTGIEHKTDTSIYRNNSDWYSKPLPNIQWSQVKERLSSFLGKYWHSINDRYDDTHWVLPEVIVCIARADSWLWGALKSANNYWNVGNNDRWDVIHYKTKKDWIKAIYNVLNNRYLGKKKTIGELSYGWWGKAPVYATSGSSWNVNVLNCLSLVYGHKVNENYIFRM